MPEKLTPEELLARTFSSITTNLSYTDTAKYLIACEKSKTEPDLKRVMKELHDLMNIPLVREKETVTQQMQSTANVAARYYYKLEVLNQLI